MFVTKHTLLLLQIKPMFRAIHILNGKKTPFRYADSMHPFSPQSNSEEQGGCSEEWKIPHNFFQCLEASIPMFGTFSSVFPTSGNRFIRFSNLWKSTPTLLALVPQQARTDFGEKGALQESRR